MLGIMCNAYASENIELETGSISQETELSTSVTTDSILGTWSGTYDGNKGSETIKRDFAISVGKFVEGEISGVAYISNGVDGSYFFTGYLDPDTGEISFSGKDWYDNPGGFVFSVFEGNYDAKTGTINTLLNTAIDWLRSKGIQEIYRESGKDNHNAHRFFEKRGFIHVSEMYKLIVN